MIHDASPAIPCDTLVTASCILTQNARREVIRDGAVAISGGRIAAVGPRAELAAAYAPAETLAMGHLCCPGWSTPTPTRP